MGPPDGRYLLRGASQSADSSPTHVLVIATLGALPRAGLLARRKNDRKAEPEPEPAAVTTGKATMIDVAAQLGDGDEARAWLESAGEDYLASDLEVLNRALHAFRLVTADPYVHPISRHQSLAARIGYGAGEQVADGLWTDARELLIHSPTPAARQGTPSPGAAGGDHERP